eukprot:COSAG02_NODE_7591_length_2944_cov_1.834095_3_plen_122_part_00
MVPPKAPDPQLGSSTEDNVGRSKLRDRDVGKKDKIRLLLPLVRAGELLLPSAAEGSPSEKPVLLKPLKQRKSGEHTAPERTGEGRWSSEEITLYEEGLENFGPTVSWVTLSNSLTQVSQYR